MRTIAFRITAFTVALPLISYAAAKPQSLLASRLTGHYRAGFTVAYVYDYSRYWYRSTDRWGAIVERRARPIRISIWYPTNAHGSTQTFSHYVTYRKTGNADFDAANAFLTARDSHNYLKGDFGGDERLLAHLMNGRTNAQPDAAPANERFPLILYAAGWNSFSPDNTLLAEDLASHGFVVATVPQLPAYSDESELAAAESDIETQVRDLQAARGFMERRPYVDPRRVGVIGYSLGSVAGMWLAMQDGGIAMFAGLDPSFAVKSYAPLAMAAAQFKPSAFRSPTLVLQSGNATIVPSHSTDVLDKLAYADTYRANVFESTHGDFSDYPAIASNVGGNKPEGESSAQAEASRVAIVRCVVTFAEAFLSESAQSRALLDARVCSHEAGPVLQKRAGAGIPTTGAFLEYAHRSGYEAAAQRYRDIAKAHPDLVVVDEDEFNVQGYRLLQRGDVADAVTAFRINVLAHPFSANAYDSLSDGYIAAGDKASSKEAYRAMLRIIDRDTSLSAAAKDRLIRRARAVLAQP